MRYSLGWRPVAMAALLLVPPATADAFMGCPATAATAAEQFLVRLDARDYPRAYALLDASMRTSLPYNRFVVQFDSRRKALGGPSTGYALRGDAKLARQMGRRRIYSNSDGATYRVGFRTPFRKTTVEEVVTVTTGRTPQVSGFRDAPVR